MNKYIVSVILGLAGFVGNSQAQVEFDLRRGIDFTATNYRSASMYNQLVDAGTIAATNKGAIIRRSGGGGSYWPDVSNNPRYTNFMWLDMNTSPATLKQYVCCGNVFSNWVVSTVTPGSVGTAEIADWSITDQKLQTNSVSDFALKASSVSGNKIADVGVIAGKLAPAAVIKGNYAPGSIVGGDITNKTITFSNIADGTLTRELYLNSSIDSTKITNGGITTANIALTNIDATLIRNDGITTSAITNGAVTTNKLAGDINSGLLNTNVSYGLAKAWAFVGVSGTTPSILKGFNIASISRLDTGDYAVFFGGSYAPVDTNYLVTTTALTDTGTTVSTYSNTTARVSVHIDDVSGADQDFPFYILIYDF